MFRFSELRVDLNFKFQRNVAIAVVVLTHDEVGTSSLPERHCSNRVRRGGADFGNVGLEIIVKLSTKGIGFVKVNCKEAAERLQKVPFR